MTQNEFINCIKRNSQRLFLIILSFTQNHSDAEDILQHVFLKLWKYDKPFTDNAHIDKWPTAVRVNESKNYIKSPFKRKSVSLEEAPETYTFKEDTSYDLYKAVASLPKKERVVIHLFYYEDMTVKDISALLKIKESAVKTRLHRARKDLKEILGDEWINA
ncbi:MAG: sigma-70 family RNA polymerase sigma factor [Eubacterium sp.]|nr:sigma-70 family RNA polymerase sigma factor [Eubacterium sp.]